MLAVVLSSTTVLAQGLNVGAGAGVGLETGVTLGPGTDMTPLGGLTTNNQIGISARAATDGDPAETRIRGAADLGAELGTGAQEGEAAADVDTNFDGLESRIRTGAAANNAAQPEIGTRAGAGIAADAGAGLDSWQELMADTRQSGATSAEGRAELNSGAEVVTGAAAGTAAETKMGMRTITGAAVETGFAAGLDGWPGLATGTQVNTDAEIEAEGSLGAAVN